MKILIELRKTLQQRYQHLGPLPPAEDSRFRREDEFLKRVRKAIEEHLDDEQSLPRKVLIGGL